MTRQAARGRLAVPGGRGRLTVPAAHGRLTVPGGRGRLTVPAAHGRLTALAAHGRLTALASRGRLAAPAPRGRLAALAARADAATPPGRDRTVDALRALAIAGVIGGHWLVTALVVTRAGGITVLRDTSPLASLPALTPLSWIFQTLAVFFLVGGYAAARGYGGGYRVWLGRRLARLGRPVLALAAVWAVLAAALLAGGMAASTVAAAARLVLDPLWFLGVFAGLTALTPLALALVRRFGAWAAALPAAVVAGADLVRFGLAGPSWVGWVNVAAGWFVPYLLGVAWARGSFRARTAPALLLAGGVAATAALVSRAGYPASMVGVNGAAVSNLNPPTLAAVTFGVAQVGLALLLRGPLARAMRRPLAWLAVATANLSAMTLFLWHQTAFLAVTLAGLLIGPLPGLLTAPSGTAWVAQRLAWLPVFAAALAGLWLLFHRAEHASGRRPAGPVPAGPVPAGPVPAGPVPAGTASTGTASTGTVPTWTASTGTVPTWTAPTGTAPTGTAPTGTAPTGTAPTGTAPTGTAPTGTVPAARGQREGRAAPARPAPGEAGPAPARS